MSHNPNPKTLADLMANALHYAEYCMRGTGNLPPTLFLVGSDGKQVMFMPENLADVDAKVLCRNHLISGASVTG